MSSMAAIKKTMFGGFPGFAESAQDIAASGPLGKSKGSCISTCTPCEANKRVLRTWSLYLNSQPLQPGAEGCMFTPLTSFSGKRHTWQWNFLQGVSFMLDANLHTDFAAHLPPQPGIWVWKQHAYTPYTEPNKNIQQWQNKLYLLSHRPRKSGASTWTRQAMIALASLPKSDCDDISARLRLKVWECIESLSFLPELPWWHSPSNCDMRSNWSQLGGLKLTCSVSLCLSISEWRTTWVFSCCNDVGEGEYKSLRLLTLMSKSWPCWCFTWLKGIDPGSSEPFRSHCILCSNSLYNSWEKFALVWMQVWQNLAMAPRYPSLSFKHSSCCLEAEKHGAHVVISNGTSVKSIPLRLSLPFWRPAGNTCITCRTAKIQERVLSY